MTDHGITLVAKRLSVRSPALLLLTVMIATSTGCRSLAGPPSFFPFGKSAEQRSEQRSEDTLANATPQSLSSVRQVSAESEIASSDENGDLITNVVEDESLAAMSKKTAKSVTNFITGREQEDRDRAKSFYQEGDALFKQASSQSEQERKKTFAKAAKLFRKSGEAAPGSAIEQDALFMQAESLFFADRLSDATDVYQTLQKEHSRNRHNDRVAARLFSISRYWIETEKSDDKSWSPINFTDASRPTMDTDGHAIRVLDQIRYDDPTGRLADDATMAAAAEFIRQEKFVEADEFLTDLRETFTDSEHLFLAHLLGIRTKLKIYGGPRYSNLVLEDADKLVKQTRTRFPDKMGQPKYAEMVARAAAEITFHKAERVAYRASYREKRKEYGAAAFYYRRILEDFGDTPHAENARERLSEIETLPEIPTPRLSWLTTVFPDSHASDPLRMKDGSAGSDDENADPNNEASGTMLR
jgi:outer membrane protein assembly factor BamD (BamD/ComL family)